MSNAYRSTLAGGGAIGDATAADVLSGKTFSNAQSTGIIGTMTNNGAISGVATPGQPYTIPAGYHNGNGVVTGSIGSSASLVNWATYSQNLPVIGVTIGNIVTPVSFNAVSSSNKAQFGKFNLYYESDQWIIEAVDDITVDGVAVTAGNTSAKSYNVSTAISIAW